jgi:hypothetical protein
MNELTFICRIGNVNYLITGTENRIDALEKLMKYFREKNSDIFIADVGLDMIDIIV